MLHLEPVATHRLDEPLSADAALTPDGRHLVFVSQASRRAWRLTLDPETFSVEATDTGVCLPPPPEDKTVARFVHALSQDGTLVALRDHGTPECVLVELPSGVERGRVRWNYGSTFSPDGRWWLRMNRPFDPSDPWVYIQDTTTGEAHDVTEGWIDAHGQVWMDMRNVAEEDHPAPETRARYRVKAYENDECYDDILAAEIELQTRKQADIKAHWTKRKPLFIDQPDSLVTRPSGDDRFEVFVGCYGFVWRCLVEPTPDGLLRRVVEPGSDLVYSDVVHDPVTLLPPAGSRYVLARHGYGSGLLAMDSERRISHKIPIRDLVEKPRYGAITHAVAGIGTTLSAVQTRGGGYLWSPGASAFPLPDAVRAPVALWDGVLLARDAEGTTLSWYGWHLEAR